MGRIKKTLVIILVILFILTIAVVVYIVRRIRQAREKRNKQMKEEEEEEIVDEEIVEMQREVVEKTPLAVYSKQDFDSDKDEITTVCKTGEFLFTNTCGLKSKCTHFLLIQSCGNKWCL